MSIAAPASLDYQGLITRIEKARPNDLQELERICIERQDESAHQFLLEWAARSGITRLVEYLLHESRANPSSHRSFSFLSAVLNGHAGVVELLLNDGRVDLTVDNHKALRITVHNSNATMMSLFLEDPRFDPSFDENKLLLESVHQRKMDMVTLLLKHPKVCSTVDRNRAIKIAMKNNDVDIISILYDDESFDPSIDNQNLVRWACAYGHLMLAKKLIMDPRVDRSIYDFTLLLAECKSNNSVNINKLTRFCMERADHFMLDILLEWSAAKGMHNLVENLLLNSAADPTANRQRSFQMAALNGHADVVVLFLKDGRVDPSLALRIAVNKSNATILSLLLEDPRVDPSLAENKLLLETVYQRKIDMVTLLLKQPKVFSAINFHRALDLAIKNNDVDMVHVLYGNGNFDPSINNFMLLKWASICNHDTLLEILMIDAKLGFDDAFQKIFHHPDPKVSSNKKVLEVLLAYICKIYDPSNESYSEHSVKGYFSNAVSLGFYPLVEKLLTNPIIKNHLRSDSWPVWHACIHGHKNIVALLLNEGGVSPSIFSQDIVLICIQYPEILQLLLEKSKTDFHALDNAAIITASELGNLEAVDLLLKHPKRVQAEARNNLALIQASANGHVNVVKRLMYHPGVNVREKSCLALRVAALNGHKSVVKLLLTHPRMKVGWNHGAISVAATYGYANVVATLLKDGRVDPSSRHNDALVQAASGGYVDVVRLLLNDPRVDPVDGDNLAIREAIKNNHEPVVSLLRNYQDKTHLSYFSLIKEMYKNQMERKTIFTTPSTTPPLPWPKRGEIMKARKEKKPHPKVLYACGILFDGLLPSEISNRILVDAFPRYLEPVRTLNSFGVQVSFYSRFYTILSEASTPRIEDVTAYHLDDAMDLDVPYPAVEVAPATESGGLKRKFDNESLIEETEEGLSKLKKPRLDLK